MSLCRCSDKSHFFVDISDANTQHKVLAGLLQLVRFAHGSSDLSIYPYPDSSDSDVGGSGVGDSDVGPTCLRQIVQSFENGADRLFLS